MSDIAQALDRVPLRDLEEAVMRRVGLAHLLSPDQRDRYRELLERVSETSGVSPALIVGSNKRPESIGARRRLYAALHRDGWTMDDIRRATGHDKNRIRRAFRNLGLTDHQEDTLPT